jgi:SCY1-like protein 2
MWMLFNAINKETKESVCVHILHKEKIPAPWKDDDSFLELMRREATMLTRMRHPHMLRLLHPLDESRSALVLISEPLTASLANVFGDTRRPRGYEKNLEKNEQIDFERLVSTHELGAIDIKNGLRQVGEALSFLHQQAKTYHAAVDPHHIFVTPQGDWKLAGMYFSSTVTARGETITSNPHIKIEGGDATTFVCPSFEYAAPELINRLPYTDAADSFSLGLLAWRLHLFIAKQQLPPPMLELQPYHIFINSLTNRNYSAPGMPQSLVEALPRLLFCAPGASSLLSSGRWSIEEFLDAEYFRDVLIRTLRYLDTILEKDLEGRVEFLKRLPQALSLFDAKTVRQRVLPPLLLQLKDVQLSVFALPSILDICRQSLTPGDFERLVVPELRQLVALCIADTSGGKDGKEGPASSQPVPPQLSYVLLRGLDILFSKSSSAFQRDFIVPLISKCLEARQPQLRQQALKELSVVEIMNKIDYRELKTQLYASAPSHLRFDQL